jgi:hypothetical protein
VLTAEEEINRSGFVDEGVWPSAVLANTIRYQVEAMKGVWLQNSEVVDRWSCSCLGESWRGLVTG